MITPSGKVNVDTSFISKLNYLPRDIERAAKVATWRTNNWLRNYSMNLLGVELRISNSGSSKKVDKRTKEVFDRRFKPYKNVKLLSGKTRVYTSKLWIGLNDVSVHRFGPIKELAGSRIKDGSGEIHNNAFIKKFRTDSHPFAVQRHVTAETSKARRKYSVIKKDIADEVEEIISSLEPEINGMFEEFFYAELRQVLSKSK